MAYRSYGKRSFDGNTTKEEKTPWTRSTTGSGSSSYCGGSTYMGIPKSSDTSTPASSDSKSTSSSTGRYGSSGSSTGTTGSSYRSSSTTGASSYRPYSSIGRSTERSLDRSTDRATDRSLDRISDRSTVSSKYGSTASSSYQTKEKDAKETKDGRDPDRPSIRDKYHMGPALPSSTTTPARDAREEKPSIRDKYGLSNTNKEDRQSLIDKYSTGTYPGRSMDSTRSYGSSSSVTKEEAPSSYSKSALSRSTSTRSEKSPEPEKTSSYNSLSPYRLYSRGSSTYSRSTSKDTDTSSTTTTPASTPVTTPTSLRFGSSRYLTRSPITEKPFSLSTTLTSDKPRRPWSPRQADDASTKDVATTATTETTTTTTTTTAETPTVAENRDKNTSDVKVESETKKKIEKIAILVVTRGTSPTPPSSSAFLRTRRADLARVIEKTISRPVERPEMVDKEIQSDRGDDTTRHSRYGTTRSTVSPWSSYLDRYSSTGAIGQTVSKYTTRTGGFSYPSTRDREPTVTKFTSSETEADTVKTSPTDAKPEKLSEKQTEKVAPDKKEEKLTGAKTETAKPILEVKKSEPKVLERLKRTPSMTKLAEALNENKNKKEDTSKTNSTVVGNTTDDKKATTSVKAEDLNKTTKPPDEPKVTGSLVRSLSVSKFGESPILKRRANLQSTDSSSTKPTVPTDSAEKTVLDKKPPIKTQSDQSNNVLNKAPTSQKDDSDNNVLNKSPSTQKADNASILSKASSTQKIENTSILSKSPSTQKVESTSILSKSPSTQKIETTDILNKSQNTPKTETMNILSKSPSTQKIETTDILNKSQNTPKTETTNILSKTPSAQKVETSTNILNKIPSSQKLDKVSDQKLANASKPPLGTKEVNSSTKDLTKIVSNDVKSKLGEFVTKKEDSVPEKTENSEIKKTSKTKGESPSASETESSKTKSSSSKSESESLTSPPTSPPSAAKPPLAKIGSPAANRKFLPPPVPKLDSHSNLKTSSSQNALNKSVTNKDFRKSTLNIDITPTDADEVQRLQEKQRLTGKLERKTKRTTSTSSDKSEGSEVTEPSECVDTKVTSSSLKQSKSLTNAKILSTSSSKSNVLSVPRPSPKRRSPSRSSRSPSRSRRSASSSMDSSSSESETSSSSDEDESPSRSDLVNRRRRTSRSPSTVDKRKSAISVTSFAVSSADESSISEKPPRPPSSPKPPPKEEPKSFLMRALAPVTNLFRSRAPESLGSSNENVSEPLQRTGSTLSLNKASGSDKEDNSSKKLGDELKNKFKIRHNESGERAWWLDSNTNIPEGIQRIQSNKSIPKISSDSEKESSKTSEKNLIDKKKANMLKRIESGERAWWLDSNANIPEGIARNTSGVSINKNVTDSDKESKSATEKQKFKIKHVESGERAWWLDSGSCSSIPDNIKKMNSAHSIPEIIEPSSQVEDTPKKFPLRHQESGEKAWWLSSNVSIPDGIKKTTSRLSLADVKEKRRSVKADTSDSSEEGSESSESEEKQEEREEKKTTGVPKFPLDVKVTQSSPPSKPNESGRTSPYDNIQAKTPAKTKKRPKDQPLFIGSHTNIDDILGTAASLVSPVMGLSRLRGEAQEDSADDEEECKEVDPKQVRVHDSTAQKPTIQSLRDGTEEAKRRQSKGKSGSQLDDERLKLYEWANESTLSENVLYGIRTFVN